MTTQTVYAELARGCESASAWTKHWLRWELPWMGFET